MLVTTKLEVNLHNPRLSDAVYAVQNDGNTRAVELLVFEGSTPWDIPPGTTAAVSFKKPDGTSGLYDVLPDGVTRAVTITGNRITAVFAPQVLTCAGRVDVSVALYDQGLNRLGLFPFPLFVSKDPSDGQDVSNNYFYLTTLAALNEAIGDLTKLRTTSKNDLVSAINETHSSIDKLPRVNPVPKSGEMTQPVGVDELGQLWTGDSGTYPDWSHLTWYVMGDSLTDRNNNHTVKRYYDFVQEKTGIQIILDGIGGTGYGAGVSNNQHFVERVKNIPNNVDIVTIFGSVNDIRYAGDTYHVTIWETLSWLALNRPGLRVIVVPPSLCKTNDQYDLHKRGTLWEPYCERLQTCALACDFRYVSDMFDCPPFNPNFNGHMEKFFTTDPEGIHPDENGHKALAPYFYNALLLELGFEHGVGGSAGTPSVVGEHANLYVCSDGEYTPSGSPTIANPDVSTTYLVPQDNEGTRYASWAYIDGAWQFVENLIVSLTEEGGSGDKGQGVSIVTYYAAKTSIDGYTYNYLYRDRATRDGAVASGSYDNDAIVPWGEVKKAFASGSVRLYSDFYGTERLESMLGFFPYTGNPREEAVCVTTLSEYLYLYGYSIDEN